MGVNEYVLPDMVIQGEAALAEALIIDRVPNYASILAAGGSKKIYLETAAIAQVCALLCSGMPNRLKIAEADETGYSFRLQSVDWGIKEGEFAGMVTTYIAKATDTVVAMPSPIGVVSNDRLEI